MWFMAPQSKITHGMIEPSKGTTYKFIKEFARKSLPEFVAVLRKILIHR